jgi:hypothetical protein
MTLIDLDLGVDLEIVDEAPPSAAPTATDTGFLIHSTAVSGSPSGVTELRGAGEAREVFAGETALLAETDAFFNVGGAKLYVSPLDTDAATAAELFTDQLGPGQIWAPEVLTTSDQNALRDFAWDHNKEFIASIADGADKAACIAKAAALIDENGRNSLLEVDTLLIPGVAGGTSREISAAAVVAGLMARSDIATGNPNLAAAGNHTPGSGGQSDYVLGIKAERSMADIKELAQNQVNCFRTVNNRVRHYGYFTLADLTTLPQWWDVSGSRTMMAIRAQEQAVAEELMFGEVDAGGTFLDKYEGQLSSVLAEFQRIRAIYGTEQKPGYTVDVGLAINPVANQAQGLITAQIAAKTSPFAAALKINLTRQALTA